MFALSASADADKMPRPSCSLRQVGMIRYRIYRAWSGPPNRIYYWVCEAQMDGRLVQTMVRVTWTDACAAARSHYESRRLNRS